MELYTAAAPALRQTHHYPRFVLRMTAVLTLNSSLSSFRHHDISSKSAGRLLCCLADRSVSKQPSVVAQRMTLRSRCHARREGHNIYRPTRPETRLQPIPESGVAIRFVLICKSVPVGPAVERAGELQDKNRFVAPVHSKLIRALAKQPCP